MSSSNLIRWGGVAAILGGILWIVPAIITAFKPRGCIGPDECEVMAMRDTSDTAPFLLLALLLTAGGLVGVTLRAWNAGRLGRLAKAGAALYVIGVALFILGTVLTAISETFWLLMLPAGLALISGLVLTGVAVFKTRVLPRWVGVLLVIGSLAMLGFNDQTAEVLMAIPFGLAWVAVGYALWSQKDTSVGQLSRVS